MWNGADSAQPCEAVALGISSTAQSLATQPRHSSLTLIISAPQRQKPPGRIWVLSTSAPHPPLKKKYLPSISLIDRTESCPLSLPVRSGITFFPLTVSQSFFKLKFLAACLIQTYENDIPKPKVHIIILDDLWKRVTK